MLRPLQPFHGGKAGPGWCEGTRVRDAGPSLPLLVLSGEPGLTVSTFLRLAVARVHLTLPSRWLLSGAGHRRQAEARLRRGGVRGQPALPRGGLLGLAVSGGGRCRPRGSPLRREVPREVRALRCRVVSWCCLSC